MRQVEVSRTIVFAQPRHARGFFEALVADNLDIGRPEQVELIFAGAGSGAAATGHPRRSFKTKVVTRGVEVTVNAFYKHSRIKQYLKDGRALRDRDRHQRPLRPGLPTPPAQPARTAGQSPCGQPSPARY